MAFDFFLPRLALPSEEYRLLGPARVFGALTNTGDGFQLAGKLEAEVETACARCLRPVALAFAADFDEEYGAEELPAGDDTVDLAAVGEQYFLASLPMRILCRQDCRGLCPQCGKALNDGDCDCPRQETDPRLAALKALLEDE